MAALGSVVAEPVVDMGVKSVRADGGPRSMEAQPIALTGFCLAHS